MPGFIIYKEYIKENKKLTINQQQLLIYYKQLFNNKNLNIEIFNEEQIKYFDDLYKLYDLDDILVLTFTQSNIKNIPDNLNNLEYLYLCDCDKIKKLPETLQNIKNIELINCNNLEFINYYPSLKELNINNCKKLITHIKYCYNLDINININ